jgi:hypothetical protein
VKEPPTGPYIVWVDYGYEGWQPKCFNSLKEAVSENHFSRFVVTKLVNYDVIEIGDPKEPEEVSHESGLETIQQNSKGDT